MPRPSHYSRFDHLNNTWWGVKIVKALIMYFSLLHCYLVLNTLSLRSSLNVSDQVSHPHKTTGKTIFLYILIFISLDSKLADKIFCTEWQQAFTDSKLLLISSWIELWFPWTVPLPLPTSDYVRNSFLSPVFTSIHRSKSVLQSDPALPCLEIACVYCGSRIQLEHTRVDKKSS